MGQKELYELKQNSIKTKYKNMIAELESTEMSVDKATSIRDAALAEIKQIKNEKYNTILAYEKKCKIYNIIADILLALGLVLFSYGLYIRLRMKLDTVLYEALCMSFGGILMLASAVFFAAVMHYRQKKQDYMKDSISETELASTKAMVNEFYDNAIEKINNSSI